MFFQGQKHVLYRPLIKGGWSDRRVKKCIGLYCVNYVTLNWPRTLNFSSQVLLSSRSESVWWVLVWNEAEAKQLDTDKLCGLSLRSQPWHWLWFFKTKVFEITLYQESEGRLAWNGRGVSRGGGGGGGGGGGLYRIVTPPAHLVWDCIVTS